jgi:hypothetical protein
MIIVDTNILSELMRRQPDAQVLKWVDLQEPEDLALTAITVAEIMLGIARLPDGKRKASLQDMANAMFDEEFSGRILAFDEVAAQHYGAVASVRERAGRPIGMADAQIAAICRSHEATLATRNVKDFELLTLELINPWDS